MSGVEARDVIPWTTPPEPGSLAEAIGVGLDRASQTQYWYAKLDAIEAALSEHGYSVIRTDPAIERLARHRAVRIYGDDIHWADFLDLCREELVVLRGDPQ